MIKIKSLVFLIKVFNWKLPTLSHINLFFLYFAFYFCSGLKWVFYTYFSIDFNIFWLNFLYIFKWCSLTDWNKFLVVWGNIWSELRSITFWKVILITKRIIKFSPIIACLIRILNCRLKGIWSLTFNKTLINFKSFYDWAILSVIIRNLTSIIILEWVLWLNT